jgi:hypothetical protein
MAMSPVYYEEALDSAPLHARIRILTTEPTVTGNEYELHITGTVIDVFKGLELVRVGDNLEFTIQTTNQKMFPPGSDVPMDHESMMRARMIESHFYLRDGSPPRFVPLCGRVIVLCSGCAAELRTKAKFCPQCGTSQAMAKCSNCQTELNMGVKFCPECGTSPEWIMNHFNFFFRKLKLPAQQPVRIKEESLCQLHLKY